jgi:hypothetical protein
MSHMTTHTNTLITIEEASKLLGVDPRSMLYGLRHAESLTETNLPPHKQYGLTLQWSDGCAYFNRADVMANVGGK